MWDLELRACARHLAQGVGREWVGSALQAKDTNDGLRVGGHWDSFQRSHTHGRRGDRVRGMRARQQNKLGQV